MGDRTRTRRADGAGSRQDLRRAPNSRRCPSQAVILALRSPAEAKLPTPPERAPKDGTFAGFASIKSAPKAGLYTISLSAGGWVDVVQDGHFLKPKAFSGADRLRRHPQDHEVRALGEPVRAAGQRNRKRIQFRLPSCRRNRPSIRARRSLYPDRQPAIVSLAIFRTAVSRRNSGTALPPVASFTSTNA